MPRAAIAILGVGISWAALCDPCPLDAQGKDCRWDSDGGEVRRTHQSWEGGTVLPPHPGEDRGRRPDPHVRRSSCSRELSRPEARSSAKRSNSHSGRSIGVPRGLPARPTVQVLARELDVTLAMAAGTAKAGQAHADAFAMQASGSATPRPKAPMPLDAETAARARQALARQLEARASR